MRILISLNQGLFDPEKQGRMGSGSRRPKIANNYREMERIQIYEVLFPHIKYLHLSQFWDSEK